MEKHMSERHDPTARIHLCDCNRSFVLDAGRALRLLYRFGDFVVLFTELFDVSID